MFLCLLVPIATVTAVYVATGRHTIIPVIILITFQFPIHIGFWLTCSYMAHGKTTNSQILEDKKFQLPNKEEGSRNE